MRREGFEFHVSRPEVILIADENGVYQEPFEEVQIETSPDTVGSVIESLSKRRGELKNMIDSSTGTVLLTFIVPSRGMLGFRYQFLTMTRGLGVMNTLFPRLPANGRRHPHPLSWLSGEPGKPGRPPHLGLKTRKNAAHYSSHLDWKSTVGWWWVSINVLATWMSTYARPNT